jgi:ubiquinone/menaquinone biosynthesis C-methylase UbiE
MVLTREYWNNRVSKYGHTGHSEPFYYCFDQQARLFAIEKIIQEIKTTKQTALDFGCGSGDFLEILSRHYKVVCGYDFSSLVVNNASKRYTEPNIVVSDVLDELLQHKRFDLVLSVTVLQYFNASELEQHLALMCQHLNELGVMLAMEFFQPEELAAKNNDDKTTYKQWYSALAKNNLKVIATHHFYNPIVAPSKSWLIYKNNLVLKLLRPFKYLKPVQKLFNQKAKKLIFEYKDVLPEKETGLSIFVIQKETKTEH